MRNCEIVNLRTYSFQLWIISRFPSFPQSVIPSITLSLVFTSSHVSRFNLYTERSEEYLDLILFFCELVLYR
jgi:hypothetical protein